mgnify:CR=1 FL=1
MWTQWSGLKVSPDDSVEEDRDDTLHAEAGAWIALRGKSLRGAVPCCVSPLAQRVGEEEAQNDDHYSCCGNLEVVVLAPSHDCCSVVLFHSPQVEGEVEVAVHDVNIPTKGADEKKKDDSPRKDTSFQGASIDCCHAVVVVGADDDHTGPNCHWCRHEEERHVRNSDDNSDDVRGGEGGDGKSSDIQGEVADPAKNGEGNTLQLI